MQKVFFIIIVLILLAFVIGNIMRKNLPYDIEIVPDDEQLLIINTTSWCERDCIVELSCDGKKIKAVLPGSTKTVSITGLKNQHIYSVKIKRKDLVGSILYRPLMFSAKPMEVDKYIVLVGASVGKSWNLRELIKRKQTVNFYGYRGLFNFDKTPVVKAIANASYKPDIVIIKECAAYFPGNVKAYIAKIEQWVQTLREAGIQPVLATVVPVTEENDRSSHRMASLNEFNQTIRALAAKNNLRVFDLQKILSDGSETGYLDKKFAAPDGLHLNSFAYEKLDNLIIEFFEKKPH